MLKGEKILVDGLVVLCWGCCALHEKFIRRYVSAAVCMLHALDL